MKYDLRNKKLLEDSRNVMENHKADLAKVFGASETLKTEKNKMLQFIDKNFPRLKTDLKNKLFKEPDDFSKKLRYYREGSDQMAKANQEIKQLSDEIQARKLELLEEEERSLRARNMLKNVLPSMAYQSDPIS